MILTLNKYIIAAIIPLVTAVVFIAIALISQLGEITTAAFVISALICVILGVLILTFSAGEPVDPHLVGILPAQGSLNLCRITHHLGVQGNAYFLPPLATGETRVMQFNPTSTDWVSEGSAPGSFRITGPPGLVLPPSCDLMIEDLRKRYAMVIPDTKENISLLIREIIEDALKFAQWVSCSWSGKTVTITFHNYSFIDGCKIFAEKSSLCCSMSPCPVCSLCGALMAEGLDKVIRLDRCDVSSSSKNVIAVFSVLP